MKKYGADALRFAIEHRKALEEEYFVEADKQAQHMGYLHKLDSGRMQAKDLLNENVSKSTIEYLQFRNS